MDQNVVTLLSVFIGGLLAIAGGVIGSYLTGKIAVQSEKATFLRSKIEEVYSLLVRMSSIDDDYYRMLPDEDDHLKAVLSNRESYAELFERLEVITRLYLQELESNFLEWVGVLRSVRAKALEDAKNGRYKQEDAENSLDRLYNASGKLRKALANYCKRKGISKL